MTRPATNKTASILLLLFALVILVAGAVAAPLPAGAAAAIAMTGPFYSQEFVIPAGAGVSGPSIYVKVSNTGTQQIVVKMRYEAVQGVTLGLSRGEFVLAPDEQMEVQVSVNVPATALRGEYPDSLRVIAEAYEQGDGGSVSASAAQVASLTVLNESANVTVNTVGPSGQPVVAHIRLFRMVGERGYEVANSYTGTLQAKVVPGTFTAEAYSVSTADRLSDPVTFDVAADRDETITLTIRMVYFENDFVVSPVRDEKTKKLLSARTMATLTNVYQPMENAQVRLQVTFNGDPLEEATVLGPLTLPLGQTGVPWNHVPAEGWKEGLYGFKYQLLVGEVLTAETSEQTLKVGGGGVGSWLWIIFVILGILGAAGLGFLIFFLVKRRREQEEKPRKKEKKREEEKPAPKAKEPVVGKPEPARQPEPARPVRPLPKEEPIVEPSPLASVSSLKARMASLGRDQGTGKPDEEEPEAGTQDEPVEPGPQAGAFDVVPPPPRVEPEPQPVVKKVEPKAQKPPASEKPAGQKPGIFSSVKATPKQEPPKPPSDIQINWPPKSVEPPKPPGDVQINWPPKSVEPPTPVEPPKPTSFAEAARQMAEAQQIASPPEEAAPGEEAAPEDPTESEAPHFRSSFAEAARLRIEARRRAKETGSSGAAPKESPADGDDAGGSGEGEDRPP